jgi:hypothetical protein
VGTAVAGFVATGAFGTLAAFTYTGQAAAAHQGATSAGTSSGNSGSPSSPASNGATGAGAGANPAPGTVGQPYQITPVQTTHHHVHVSTGGSG